MKIEKQCKTCHGSGEIIVWSGNPNDAVPKGRKTCSVCKGHGRVYSNGKPAPIKYPKLI